MIMWNCVMCIVMMRRPQGFKHTDALLPYTTLLLSHMWRMAKFAGLNRLTLDEYLLMRGLIGAGHGLEADATKALADLQQALETVAMLRAMKTSAYELAYILTGQQSRSVNPSYRPANLPEFLDQLVTGARSERRREGKEGGS